MSGEQTTTPERPQEIPPERQIADHTHDNLRDRNGHDEHDRGDAKAQDGHDQHGHDQHGHDQHAEGEIPKDLPKPSAFTVLLVGIIFAALLLALLVVGWIPHHREAAQAKADAGERGADVPVVSTVHPMAAKSEQDLFLPGNLKAEQDTALFPRTNGYLKSLKADIGDHVKAGQLLAEIDTPEVDAQLASSRGALEQAKANVVKAQSDYDLAHRTAERFEEWMKDNTGGVTVQMYDEKKSADSQAAGSLAAAKANVVGAEADVQRLESLQGFEKVIAPFDGVVTARGYDVGALLSANGGGAEMFHLAQIDPMRVYINVPQVYSTSVNLGSKVHLSLRNYPGREFEGTVTRTSNAIDPVTRTLTAELHFPNPSGELYPGMYGTIRLNVSNEDKVLTIPSSALIFNAAGLQVVTVKDDKAVFRPVGVGRDLGTDIEITNGLKPDDVVVSNPGERLVEGVAVKAVALKQAQPGAAAGGNGQKVGDQSSGSSAATTQPNQQHTAQ